jgi:hypothetical protein
VPRVEIIIELIGDRPPVAVPTRKPIEEGFQVPECLHDGGGGQPLLAGLVCPADEGILEVFDNLARYRPEVDRSGVYLELPDMAQDVVDGLRVEALSMPQFALIEIDD